MEPHCIPLAEIRHTTALFADTLNNFKRVAKFFAIDPNDVAGWARAAADAACEPARARAVADALSEQNQTFGAGEDTQKNIERLRDAGTVAVVTGQQVGLFGGPAYSVYKAATAVRLAADLAARGTPAVPVFWLASEDHDFAEVNHCTFLDGRGELVTLGDPGAPAENTPVGRIQFGKAINEVRAQATAGWPAEASRWLAGYAPGANYAEAFARMLLQLFAGRGLVLLDPQHPALHALARGLYRRAFDDAEAVQAELQKRERALKQAGYHAQVRLRPNATLLFLDVEGRRLPLRRRANGAFTAGERELNAEELRGEIESAPERFSPNVLLRPLVQDWLLPTAAYVAGPNELAYFAQASTLYDMFEVRMPAIVPRMSVTLVEPKPQRLLKKYGLTLRDFFRGPAYARAQAAARLLPRGLARRLAAAEKQIEKLTMAAARDLRTLDPTLAAAAETSRCKMLYQFGRLRGKAARAQAERSALLDAHLRALSNALYPEGGLQERRVSFLSFAARHGTRVVERLLEDVSVPGRDHQVIFL